ncbi:MAG: hypothetical protein GY804_04165 [Alphaproteobacteria bacterium]|nr:hypothetical protein [Alphaproteobacteria bacterium]
MDIEFIKDVCTKAGFKITKDSDGEEYVYYTDDRWIAIECLYDDPVLCPFTLQRAIESVNRYNLYEGFFIAYDNLYIKVCDCKTNKVLNLFEVDDQDQAKESALKYIYEQEKK